MVDNLFVNWFLLRVTPTPTIQERHLKVSTHLPIPGQSHVMTISCPPLPFPFSLLRSWKKIKISRWQLPLASALPIAAFARGPQGQIPIGSLLRLDFIWSFCSFMCSVECADVEEEKDEVFSPKFLKIFLIFTVYVELQCIFCQDEFAQFVKASKHPPNELRELWYSRFKGFSLFRFITLSHVPSSLHEPLQRNKETWMTQSSKQCASLLSAWGQPRKSPASNVSRSRFQDIEDTIIGLQEVFSLQSLIETVLLLQQVLFSSTEASTRISSGIEINTLCDVHSHKQTDHL